MRKPPSQAKLIKQLAKIKIKGPTLEHLTLSQVNPSITVQMVGGMSVGCCGKLINWKPVRFVDRFHPKIEVRNNFKPGVSEVLDGTACAVDRHFAMFAYVVCPRCLTFYLHSSTKEGWNKFQQIPKECRSGRTVRVAGGDKR